MVLWLKESTVGLGIVTTQVRIAGQSIEALVDTGATTMALPEDIVRRLGLKPDGWRIVQSQAGNVRQRCIEQVEIEVLGRKMVTNCVVSPLGVPPLIGRKQLEQLDLVIFPKRGEIRVNTLGAVPLLSEWFDSGCGAGPRVRWLPSGLIEIEGEGTPKKSLPKAVLQWASIIRQAAEKHGLPPQLIAASISAESGGQQQAHSYCCYGLMGLLPQTASSQAGRTVSSGELLNNPALNVDLGSKLYATLMQKYGGNVLKATASYNAGSPRCGAGRCGAPNRWHLVADCVGGVAFDYQTRVISYSNAAVTELGAGSTSVLPVAKAGTSILPLALAVGAVAGVYLLSKRVA